MASVPTSRASRVLPHTLDRQPIGRPSAVVAVDDVVASELIRDGIYPGAMLVVVARAPLGGPTILAVGGVRVAVSSDVARAVTVVEVGGQRGGSR